MAHPVNEMKQRQIEAAADVLAQENALNALLDAQTSAKKQVQAQLRLQAEGKLTADEDKQKLTAAEASLSAFDDRLSGQRKLVSSAKKEAADADAAFETETARLAAEDAKLRTRPSGRVSVSAPNSDKDPNRGYETHTSFFREVMRAGMGGGITERLKPLATVGSDEAGTYSNPAGGYLVPHGIAPGILSVRPEEDPLAGLITMVPMAQPTVSYNARVDKNHTTSVSGGFVVTRRAETVAGTTSRATFEQITLTANEEWGFAFASERILTDSPESFVAIIQAGFKDEYLANAMNERINGTGNGERLGVLNSGAKISVSKEAGQAGATITKENIDKMAARSWRYSRAVWLANHNTRPQLRSLKQDIGTGGATVSYFQSNPGGQEFLDGRPIYFTEFAKTLGTEGDLILSNWSEYLEGTYQTEQYAESIHVRFDVGERAFRFYRRNDGRPWWSTFLTPKNGSTLSPIVTLATRA